MDAHVFRRLCDVLVPLLSGARLEKIQSPASGVHTFTFYAHHRKRHLILRADRRTPFLFLASAHQGAGRIPDAPVMRLRKYLVSRRVAACLPDWTARRLSLLFRSAPEAGGDTTPPEIWMVLDLREGPRLLLGACPEMPAEAVWPAPSELAAACAGDGWRAWPMLTPALRRTLPHLEALEQQALLADLAAGGGDLFVYTSTRSEEDAGTDNVLPEIFAWPLPDALRRGRMETVFEDPAAATTAVGDVLVSGGLAHTARTSAAMPYTREEERLSRLLKKLDAEERRLRDMLTARERALALQAQLWRFGQDARAPEVELPAPDGVSAPLRIPLDPRLTIRENMAALFHTAARGERGLAFLEQRRKRLLDERRSAGETARATLLGVPVASPAPDREKPRWGGNLPKGVQAFLSSDGLVILRGKDAKGNWALLKAAAPYDLWLHVEGGPGSHAIIRRSFAGQDIPERTLHEAGGLAAAKSWQRDNEKAHILCAEVRHVRPLRGAAPGTVRVDKVARTVQVAVDAGLESRLSFPSE